MADDTAALLSLIQHHYGSLETPVFSFVNRVVSEMPYRLLIEQLRQVVAVDETTDLNDDVSFVYTLRRDQREWCLMLSMLGPYAVVLRRRGRVYEVLEEGIHRSDIEHQIHSLLAQHHVRGLSRHILETPVPLHLSNTERGRVRLFQALFADTDLLPWDEAASG